MVSDSELVRRLREFLSTADLNTTSTTTVRRQLEQDFGIDLSDRKEFVRNQVDLYLESHFQVNQENEKNEGEMEVQEEEENDEGPPTEVKMEVSEEEEDPKEEEEEDPEEEEEEEVEESEASAKVKGKSSKKKYVLFNACEI